ncbi:transglutaminase-like domain-containing protein [Treponema sp. R80B11-R83G3]
MKKRFLLFIVNCSLLIAHSLFAEDEFSLSIAPTFEMPVGVDYLNSGMGAAVSLDWSFLSFAKNFNFGLSAGGGFSSINAQIGEPLTIFEGKIGPFLRWQPLDRWAFRAGIGGGVYQYSRGDLSAAKAMASFNLGAEFHVLPYLSFFAEGVYNYRLYDPPKPISSINAITGIRLNLSEIMGGRARIRIEKTEQYRVFPVSWAWYEHNPIAKVKIYNDEPNAITDVTLSFYMDSYMSQPWAFANLPRVASGETVEVPVTALFNEVLINLIENVNAAGVIQIQYRSLGAKKESVSVVQMPLFHRNAFSWEDDRRAAAFVSPRDSSVRIFSRYVASAIQAQELSGSGSSAATPKNVRYAAAMFEALRLYGISYVVVPATSYKSLSANEAALDNVSYPYQALYYRGGDCTYLSILFCSLLEAIDIETAFITVPGHLYLAFEVGDDAWRKGSSDIIELDGKRWMPVEITVPGEGFTRASRIGASEWKRYGSQATLYPIREAWEFYPPVTVPASGDHPPDMPLASDIVKAMEAELRK